MNDSASSLALTDRSQISVTESESTGFRHSYNTRLSAKLKSLTPRPDVTPGKRQINEVNVRRSIAEPKVIERIGETAAEPYCDVVMRTNYQVPAGICAQSITSWERLSRYAILFFAIFSVVLICSYLGYTLSDSERSVDCVKKELKRFKHDMLDLKEEVQSMLTNKEHTNKKLETIQTLLTDLKRAHDKIAQFGSSGRDPTKRKGSSPDVVDALKVYDADKTGKTDFALESAGGSVVSIKGTENYPSGDMVNFFGIPLCPTGNGPRAMLQPGNLPGECWAFKGSSGNALIQLLGRVRISSVSLEHIPKTLSPSGEISTAPKDFSIWGLSSRTDNNGDLLGQFVYDIDGTPIQEFEVKHQQKAYNFVELKVHSNNGNPDFTCVYRLRVHGHLEAKRI